MVLSDCLSIPHIILAVCFSVINAGDLPSYIPRCSLSDPNLNECIKDTANKVIPKIAKGDEQLGLPNVSPITFKEAPIVAENLIFFIYNSYCDDIKNTVLTEVSFDLKNLKIALKAHINRIDVTADNYTIANGLLIDIPASGHGRFDMTVLDLSIDYKSDLRIRQKGGEDYVELVNPVLKTEFERCFSFFENIKSPKIDDVNAYLNEKWEKFREQLKPTSNNYLITYIHYPLSMVFNKVPLSKIFLP